MTFGKRIAMLRTELKMTQGELALTLNISRPSLALYETDKRSPDPDTLKKFADFFNVSIDYLLGYSDIRYKELPLGAIDPGEHLTIPVLGIIRAGEPIYAECNVIGYAAVPKFLITSGEYFYLRVSGDSMNQDNIIDGGHVLVRRQDVVENGDTAVVIVDGDEATIKKFYKSDTTITLMPKSSNPIHQPTIIDIKKTPVKVIGKIVYSLTKI